MDWLKYLKDKYQYTQTVIPTKEQLKMAATQHYDYAKGTIPKYTSEIKNITIQQYQYAKENIPKIKDKVIDIHKTHVKPMTSSLRFTSKIIRISALMGGTGLFMFGLGYALNPIAKIIDKKN